MAICIPGIWRIRATSYRGLLLANISVRVTVLAPQTVCVAVAIHKAAFDGHATGSLLIAFVAGIALRGVIAYLFGSAITCHCQVDSAGFIGDEKM